MRKVADSINGEMWSDPDVVQIYTYFFWVENDEWPTPAQLHAYTANRSKTPLEFAEFDVLNALEKGYVYGLPTVVAMRLGEALGDWQDPLPPEDTGWRIAVPEEVLNRWESSEALAGAFSYRSTYERRQKKQVA